MGSEGGYKNAVLFIGIQASGKSAYYERNYASTHVHISLDVLHTRNKERLLLEECIAQGRSFVVDNTNPTAKDRERYIQPAKEAGYHITGLFFKSSIRECMARNEERTGKAKVPSIAIAATSNKLELPKYDEGFDDLYYVFMDNGKFIVESWVEPDEI